MLNFAERKCSKGVRSDSQERAPFLICVVLAWTEWGDSLTPKMVEVWKYALVSAGPSPGLEFGHRSADRKAAWRRTARQRPDLANEVGLAHRLRAFFGN
jgi:hypothetical protein